MAWYVRVAMERFIGVLPQYKISLQLLIIKFYIEEKNVFTILFVNTFFSFIF